MRRPGGRSARVRADVHDAVSELLRERDARDVSVAAVAERAGVHQATIYRRWGSVPALVEEVVGERLSATSPMPDTGSLRGDLERYATKAADDLRDPMAAAYLKGALVGGERADGASPPLAFASRVRELQEMLDRAAARGEPAISAAELVEVVLVPMYFRVLAANEPPTRKYALELVERLLAIAGAAAEQTGRAGGGR